MNEIRPFEINRLGEKYEVFLSEDIEVLNFVIEYGYKYDNNRGYAHLLEHMIIQSNKELFSQLNKEGIYYNATTAAYTTAFTFINFEKDVCLTDLSEKLRGIFLSEFTEEQLRIERKTITEELLLLEARLQNKEEAQSMLGSKNDIENFTLEKLVCLRERFYQSIHIIHFSNADAKGENFNNDRVLSSMKNINKKGDSIILDGILNREAREFLYCLRIMEKTQLDRKYFITRVQNENEFRIEIHGYKEFIEAIRKKNLYWIRYVMLCTTFKFLLNEVTYIVTEGIWDMDVSKIFMGDWEVCIYEAEKYSL